MSSPLHTPAPLQHHFYINAVIGEPLFLFPSFLTSFLPRVQYSAERWRLGFMILRPGSLWRGGKLMQPSLHLLAEYCTYCQHNSHIEKEQQAREMTGKAHCTRIGSRMYFGYQRQYPKCILLPLLVQCGGWISVRLWVRCPPTDRPTHRNLLHIRKFCGRHIWKHPYFDVGLPL